LTTKPIPVKLKTGNKGVYMLIPLFILWGFLGAAQLIPVEKSVVVNLEKSSTEVKYIKERVKPLDLL